uniref:Uncharacterized protein n=1 Tax=Oryzias sinensis TaxID=183150 RepID=A0A8C7Y883_9TELE
ILNPVEPLWNNPGKTPIQILHEYGIKSGNHPMFMMEKAEGQAHQPSFVFSVTVGDVTCVGMLDRLLCFKSVQEITRSRYSYISDAAFAMLIFKRVILT